MAISFNLFLDAALTLPLSAPLTFYPTDDNPTPEEKTLWFGSPVDGTKCQASSAPGVDQIVLSVTDSNTASGEPTSAVAWALTQSLLDTATGGEALNLGVTVNSGVANAVPVWVKFTDTTGTLGNYNDLGWTFNNLFESAR
jgi:hypothetical protein